MQGSDRSRRARDPARELDVRGAKGKRWMDRQTDNVYLIHVCACDRARVRVRVSVRACMHEATVQRFWWIDRRRERSWPSRHERGPHASLPVTKIWRDLLYPEQLGPTAWLTLETLNSRGASASRRIRTSIIITERANAERPRAGWWRRRGQGLPVLAAGHMLTRSVVRRRRAWPPRPL